MSRTITRSSTLTEVSDVSRTATQTTTLPTETKTGTQTTYTGMVLDSQSTATVTEHQRSGATETPIFDIKTVTLADEADGLFDKKVSSLSTIIALLLVFVITFIAKKISRDATSAEPDFIAMVGGMISLAAFVLLDSWYSFSEFEDDALGAKAILTIGSIIIFILQGLILFRVQLSVYSSPSEFSSSDRPTVLTDLHLEALADGPEGDGDAAKILQFVREQSPPADSNYYETMPGGYLNPVPNLLRITAPNLSQLAFDYRKRSFPLTAIWIELSIVIREWMLAGQPDSSMFDETIQKHLTRSVLYNEDSPELWQACLLACYLKHPTVARGLAVQCILHVDPDLFEISHSCTVAEVTTSVLLSAITPNCKKPPPVVHEPEDAIDTLIHGHCAPELDATPKGTDWEAVQRECLQRGAWSTANIACHSTPAIQISESVIPCDRCTPLFARLWSFHYCSTLRGMSLEQWAAEYRRGNLIEKTIRVSEKEFHAENNVVTEPTCYEGSVVVKHEKIGLSDVEATILTTPEARQLPPDNTRSIELVWGTTVVSTNGYPGAHLVSSSHRSALRLPNSGQIHQGWGNIKHISCDRDTPLGIAIKDNRILKVKDNLAGDVAGLKSGQLILSVNGDFNIDRALAMQNDGRFAFEVLELPLATHGSFNPSLLRLLDFEDSVFSLSASLVEQQDSTPKSNEGKFTTPQLPGSTRTTIQSVSHKESDYQSALRPYLRLFVKPFGARQEAPVTGSRAFPFRNLSDVFAQLSLSEHQLPPDIKYILITFLPGRHVLPLIEWGDRRQGICSLPTVLNFEPGAIVDGDVECKEGNLVIQGLVVNGIVSISEVKSVTVVGMHSLIDTIDGVIVRCPRPDVYDIWLHSIWVRRQGEVVLLESINKGISQLSLTSASFSSVDPSYKIINTPPRISLFSKITTRVVAVFLLLYSIAIILSSGSVTDCSVFGVDMSDPCINGAATTASFAGTLVTSSVVFLLLSPDRLGYLMTLPHLTFRK
eukprot:TRINITY_DN915_c0_g1_i1.p1 TRINITY_DN915_c0_g1~~TRINITY_DN915_c0_g1_i1.p1  ORF type:complete len:998 (+),score=133.24 TRINITY_DN915_c0_g1_i1:50-3043(+)